jgi:hypothetical protein
MEKITQNTIHQIINYSKPEKLSPGAKPPVFDDHVAHMLQLTDWGQTTLAADHLLFPEINGTLTSIVSGVIRRLNILFASSKIDKDEKEEALKKKIHSRQYAYELLIEIALNFFGLESRWLNEGEKKESIQSILHVLDEWETLERREGGFSIAAALIGKWLSRMKRVQKGISMVAKTASRIEDGLDLDRNFLNDFLKRAETEIKENIYYRMVKEGVCKFGNDYALGLRWLRHLGFEQVSTNPVLAARAYYDEPEYAGIFQDEIKDHPNFKQWSLKPEKYAEEITLFATLLVLWENLHIFRPIFFNLRETSGGGVVSFQLNPNIAHLVEESIRDVFKAFSLASENLSVYDRYLLAGYGIDAERGRPNLVIKVAATSPAARSITRVINSFGFGSNITVDFSVGQEVTLILDEMEGMAQALKKGIRPTQLYMTNMGGRLESHLREVKLEEFFQELRHRMGEEKATEKIRRLSEKNGTRERVLKAKSYEEKVRAATQFAHGQKKIDEPIFKALREVASQESLLSWEEAIGKSGAFVARRVWSVFFSETNRGKWIAYLTKRHPLTPEQARFIMNRIYYLPASKRKPLDTYWTLSSQNFVHTEFPDHQENVRRMGEVQSFNLKEFEESISHNFSPEVLEQLIQIEDFRKAYQINSELAEIFREIGISGDFGLEGLNPQDWPQFGPVRKTLAEFKSAYDTFQQEMVSILRTLVRRRPEKKKPLEKNRRQR